jgi:hypothetical protein
VQFPTKSQVKWTYPAKGNRPAFIAYWYEGGLKPPTPEEMLNDPYYLNARKDKTKPVSLPGSGSLFIGTPLVGVAIFLAREVKSLLIGESADPALTKIAEQLVEEDPNVDKLVRMLTLQQGPGEIVVAMKLKFRAGLETSQLVDAINAFERNLEAKAPEVKWSFIEPDNVD